MENIRARSRKKQNYFFMPLHCRNVFASYSQYCFFLFKCWGCLGSYTDTLNMRMNRSALVRYLTIKTKTMFALFRKERFFGLFIFFRCFILYLYCELVIFFFKFNLTSMQISVRKFLFVCM